MKKIVFEKPGKTKSDLINCVERIEKKFQHEITKNDINIKKEGDTFIVKAVKKKIFIKFWINAKILLDDGLITMEYDSNIPESYKNNAIKMIEKEINSECY